MDRRRCRAPNRRAFWLNHFLEVLQRANLDLLRGRFRFEQLLFFGEGVNSPACFLGRLFLDDQFAQTGHRKGAAFAQALLNNGL